MDFALVYLLRRAVYRFGNFFHHWYVHGTRNLLHCFISVLEKVDRAVAIRVTIRYFFQPLYKDYTVLGSILGIFFRSGRISIGLLAYALLAAAFLLVYLGWILLPPAFLFYAAKGV